MRIVKQNRFKNLGELHKEWTEAGVKASRAIAVSIETETINRNMDSFMEKLTALQRKIDGIGDQNGQRE